MSKSAMTMKTLPVEHRPIEKCLAHGAWTLSDAELLSVIFRSGTQGEMALDLAKKLLALPQVQGLGGLHHLHVKELLALRGIGKVKSAQVLCLCELSNRISRHTAQQLPSFTNPQQVAARYMEQLRHEDQERVLLLLLNAAGKLLGEEMISLGSSLASAISPREIYLKALSYQAVGIILLHNHPGGDPSPSREDCSLTQRIVSSGKMLGIPLLDHIIIGDKRYFSFSAEQMI